MFLCSPIRFPLDDAFRVSIETLKSSDSKDEKNIEHLIILLETSGGYIETVERIISVARNHYEEISFIVPSHAYSAGTVMVLAGDNIFMDYYSVLGPIDPQFEDENGKELLPGAGYLAKFKELTETINLSPPGKAQAELAYLVKKFDPAKLFHIEQSIEHAQSLIT